MCQNDEQAHGGKEVFIFLKSQLSILKIKNASLANSPCTDCLYTNNDIKGSEVTHLKKEA